MHIGTVGLGFLAYDASYILLSSMSYVARIASDDLEDLSMSSYKQTLVASFFPILVKYISCFRYAEAVLPLGLYLEMTCSQSSAAAGKFPSW